MKKVLLPLLLTSTLPSVAIAEVVIYGKANVSVHNADKADNSQLEVVSNASRVGVKGGEEISSGLKAIYQFEYQTEVDDGSGGNNQTFGQRNIYVGLQGSAGTIMGGKFDTPTKTAQEKIDLFNDLEGDFAYLVKGETRANNIVQYVTPASMGNFAVNLAMVAAEAGVDNQGNEIDADDGVSASVTYTTPALYLGLATEQDTTAQGLDITRFAVRYTLDALQLGGLYEQSSLNDLDNDAWLVSAKYNANEKLAYKIQYGDAGFEVLDTNVVVDSGRESLSLGVDYLLSKNTTIFGYYTQESADTESVETADDNWLGVGLELKF